MITLKKLIALGILGLSLVIFLSSTSVDQKQKEETLIGSIQEILSAYHYNPQQLNDDFSLLVYNVYLKTLDYNKMYLLQEDITILDTYKHKIDDEIKQKEYNFFNLSVELIDKRIDESGNLYKEILSKPFDFTIDESLELDEEQRSFAKNATEHKDFWRKTLKYQVLDKLIDLQKAQTEALEKSDTVTEKSFEELELEARDYVLKKYEGRYSRIDKINREDRLSNYINAIAGCFDPHTGYFPPKDKEDFDISISGKLEGIGATLSMKDEFIKVVRIVPGSASWRQGDLEAEDLILKVGQDTEEPVDIVGMRLDDAVQLIRGPKGSKVVLTVKKIDGTVKKIPIIRDVVILEETYAKSTIINTEQDTRKIGYIYLPKFYVDFDNSNGRRCSIDIKKELGKLKDKNVEGIILDLRQNGGGSLSDVVEIGGYFIKTGPIVQVRSKLFDSKVQKDNDPSIEYDGPLIILVNTFSASASEILAAAMQDYGRAVIIGTNSTYGKGTVQQFLDIDRFLSNEYNSVKPLGALKITIQKFYRINGGATQLRGVVPDIVLPDNYAYLDIGEKELDNPLAWDQVEAVEYEKWNKDLHIDALRKQHEKRIAKDTINELIDNSAKWLKAQRDRSFYSLNLNEFKKENEIIEQTSNKYKNIGKSETGLVVTPLNEEIKLTTKLDTIKKESQKEWFTQLSKDIQLHQTYSVMLDMLDN